MAWIAIEACDAKKPLVVVPKVPGIKPSVSLMPKLKKALTMVKTANLQQYINNGESFNLVHDSVKLFKKMRQEMKARNVSKATTEEKNHLLEEINVCQPINPNEQCYSKCEPKDDTSYLWCNTRRSWSVCRCQLRDEIIDYFNMKKNEFLTLIQKKPWLSETEVALITSLVVVLFLEMVSAMIGFWYVRKLKNQEPQLIGQFGQNGVFIQNPIYQPEQAQNEGN